MREVVLKGQKVRVIRAVADKKTLELYLLHSKANKTHV